ncbi:MAG: hypothetical protein EBT13_11675, partial [Rhodobacteraceae bacterium]|nr:hypothetical protein [Paracoccaceae bacterium]
MTEAEIKRMQDRIGVVADGFFGPRSIAAVQAHLRGLMPKKNPWPEASQTALTAFYGRPGDESKLVPMDVSAIGLRYDGKPVRIVRCHRAVASSMLRIFAAIAAGPHKDALERYAGCYNNRTMRNGSLPSLHARGAAVDLDPDSNGNHSPWPTRATMPLEVMEEFAKEGWMPAGAF